MDREFILLIIKGIFAVIAMILTKYVVPLLREWYESRVDDVIKKVIKDSVEAFEQTIKGSGKGPLKKEEVLNYVIDYLDKKGIKIDDARLDILIEAAVYTLNNNKLMDY